MNNKKFNFKHIHLGSLLKARAEELILENSFLCDFFGCENQDLVSMYDSLTLDTTLILKWSEVLGYDFFRIYSEHLILYSPQTRINKERVRNKHFKKQDCAYRKNIYTKEMIDFILEMLSTGQKSKGQIMQDYGIPNSTLHKWLHKYPNLK